MKVFGITYTFSIVTIELKVTKEKRVALHTAYEEFVKDIRRLKNMKIDWAPDIQVVEDLKIFMGEIPECDLSVVEQFL